MDSEPWYPGGEDGVPEEWRDGDEPPQFNAEEEPDVPDPNMEGMPTIWGYEDCDFDKKKKERPPFEHHRPVEELPPQEMKSVAIPGEEECRQAIVTYVESNGCFGKEPINTMTINKITGSNGFTYTLESYMEKRKAGYEFKPYKGGEIDDPGKGRAPEAWDIHVKVKEMFKKQEEKMEVPHTSTVRTCHHCCGLGFVRCWPCSGWGRFVCRHCSGFSSMGGEGMGDGEGVHTCNACKDAHFEECIRCMSSGRVVCPTCDGYRAIRCFIELKVKFKSHKDEYVQETTDLPDNLITEVKGVKVFEQTHERVSPIKGFPIPDIDSYSERFLSKHRLELMSKKRLIQQHQKVVAVPVAEVEVTWKEQAGRFWVYGTERKVYCPDYPDTCACCVIL